MPASFPATMPRFGRRWLESQNRVYNASPFQSTLKGGDGISDEMGSKAVQVLSDVPRWRRGPVLEVWSRRSHEEHFAKAFAED
jgi:hypothetical protein